MKYPPVTLEQLRSFERFQHLNDNELQQILETLECWSQILLENIKKQPTFANDNQMIINKIDINKAA